MLWALFMLAAMGPGCDLRLLGEGLPAGWAAQLEAARANLVGRSDVDRCAEVVVRARSRGAEVTVSRSDGRTASRPLETPADLQPTIAALLLLPPAPDPPPTPPPPVASPPVMAPSQAPVPAREVSTAEPLAFELDASAGTRFAGGNIGSSLGAATHLAVGRWLAGARFRRDDFALVGSGLTRFALQSAELGGEFGFRMSRGPVNLTLLAGPRVAWLWQQMQADVTVGMSKLDPLRLPAPRSGVVPRMGTTLEASLLLSPAARLFVDLDGSADLAFDAGNQNQGQAGTPLLPAGSVGIALGGELGLRP